MNLFPRDPNFFPCGRERSRASDTKLIMHGNRGSRAMLADDSAAKFTTKLDLDDPGPSRSKPMVRSDSLRPVAPSITALNHKSPLGVALHELSRLFF